MSGLDSRGSVDWQFALLGPQKVSLSPLNGRGVAWEKQAIRLAWSTEGVVVEVVVDLLPKEALAFCAIRLDSCAGQG